MRALPTTLAVAVVLVSASAALAGDNPPQTKTSQDNQATVEIPHKTRGRLGAITVGAGYTHWSGPGYYRYTFPYYYPWLWDTSWAYWVPYYHPGFFTGFTWSVDKGEVKLATEPKSAEVYLDGAYAGTAGDLKTIWLEPGAYNLAVKADQRAPFERRIYVLSGKTLRITAKLDPATEIKP